MATYAQSSTKKQKVRDPIRPIDSGDNFPGIEKIEYRNDLVQSENLSYRFYCAGERIHGRSMEEWMRLAVSFTAFRSNGSDMLGKATYHRNWNDYSNTLENYKRCIRAFFDFCSKLGIKYWTAFDTDLFPHSDSYEEYQSNCDEMTEFISENMQRTLVKPLWIAPDFHSSPRYAAGAATACEVSIYTQAAKQMKRVLETAHRLNSECFLIWPVREGYESVYKTDIQREMKQFAKLLKMGITYKEKLSYRGQLLLATDFGLANEMSWSGYYGGKFDDSVVMGRHSGFVPYIRDAFSAMSFLKYHSLDRNYKITLRPGHDLFMSIAYGTLGSVDIDQGSVDIAEFNIRESTLLMKSMIEQGSILPGGINLNIAPSRMSVDVKDMFYAHINWIDQLARGLRTAAHIVADQVFSKHIQKRYTSFYSGFGSRLSNGDATLDECEEYVKKLQNPTNDFITSSRNEQWENAFQRYLDGNRDAL